MQPQNDFSFPGNKAISLENTQIAFSGKNNYELNRAYLLFKLVSSNKLVKFGKVFTDCALKIKFPINFIIKPTIFKHFCGGENIEECDLTIQDLAKFRIGTILDYSVEGKQSEKDFDRTTKETIATIEKANGNNSIPFCVFKVTGLARFALLEKLNNKLDGSNLTAQEKEEFERVRQRVDAICKRSFQTGTPVFIDAEESWIQDVIDMLAVDMMKLYNKEKAIVFNTLQMYRHDRLAYLKNEFENAKSQGYYMGLKIVRGAYMEKERKRAQEMGYSSPIQPDKASTDSDYDAAIKFCVENNQHIAICAGTHNEESSLYLANLMDQFGIDHQSKSVYFAQLLGMSDHISYNLANASYNVAKYVPYGPVKDVLPYLIRRAEENTSVAGQTGRELSLIMKEKARRKAKK